MKKQKNKKWGTREQRDEWRFLSSFHSKAHTNVPLKKNIEYQFPRLLRGRNRGYYNMNYFLAAGYPGAVLLEIKWGEVHDWCRENIVDYTWTGSYFWFQNDLSRDLFMKEFNSEKLN